MAYTPSTQGGTAGAAPGSSNAFSSDKQQYAGGNFDVVTNPTGGGSWYQPGQRPAHGGIPDLPATAKAADLVHALVDKSPGEIAALQQQLIAAGYMPKSAGVSGVVDNDTRQAYAQLLQETQGYNLAGKYFTPDDILAQKQAGLAASAAAGVGKAPKVGTVFSTSAPIDVAQTAQTVAQTELGRKLTSKQLAQFVAVYHGIEAHKNAQVAGSDAVTQAGGDVSVQQAPSASAAASNFVQSNFAPEYGANSVANTFDAFRKMVS